MMFSRKKTKKNVDKLTYDFMVNFHQTKLQKWSEDERFLRLPDNKTDKALFKANIRALTRILTSSQKQWISCKDEQSVRFKRSSLGSTRHRTDLEAGHSISQDSFALFENDSGLQEEMIDETHYMTDQELKLKQNMKKLQQIIDVEQNSDKLIMLLSSLNNHFEAEFVNYDTSPEEESNDLVSSESIFEPQIKRAREVEAEEISHLNSFMTRGPQRRTIGNPMQTLVLKLSTIVNMSSRQILTCIDIMQEDLKLWDKEVYEKGMTSDRVIRSIAYRILPLHEFFVKRFLQQSEYLWLCNDGARKRSLKLIKTI